MKRLRKINSKFFFCKAFIALSLCLLTFVAQAQISARKQFDSTLTPRQDTIPRKIIVTGSDTTRVPVGDSSQLVQTDTITLKLSPDTLDAPVQYYAQDSAVIGVRRKTITLYGKTETKFQDIKLNAPKVDINQETQIMTATNSKDSTGTVTQEAKFAQGDQEFVMDTIVYNFKTQKGVTKNTITQSGEMFVHGETVKKVNKEVTYVARGFFTTCNLDEPHFGFRSNKIKVINKKIAVSGPAHPEFEGVPVPVYLPFGIYPIYQGRKSGLIAPQFATNDQMGLGLEEGGYYKVINDYWDVKFYGSIYSYGSWSGYVNPTYRKRYRYSGTMNFGLQKTKRSFKGDPDFYSSNSYRLIWSHASDSRARPGTSFSANVNASTTTFNKNVPNSPYLNFQNQLGSHITYSKTWEDKPFNFTASALHNQNNQTGIVTLNLPNLGFTVNTVYPFEKKEIAGSKKWYEQLGIGYSGNFQNTVSFYDTAFRLRDLVDSLQWGAQHNIPISLSLPPILGGAVMISPSISYSQVWIAQSLHRVWNDSTKKIDSTINRGFYTDHQTSFGLSFSTALFGKAEFKKSKGIQALRHAVRPTISFNYRPDLSKNHFYTLQIDTTGYKRRVSEFDGAIYSGYSEGRTGGISFGIDNNLEMKWRSKKDTGENAIKKIRLIDGFGFSGSYNFLADSFRLSPIGFYFRTNIFEKVNINAQTSLIPYKLNRRGDPVDTLAWKGDKFSLGTIRSGSISMSTSFQSKPRDEELDKKKKDEMDLTFNDPVLQGDRERLMDYMRQNPAEFVDFNIPWQISVSFSLNFYRRTLPDYTFRNEVNANIGASGSFSLTPKWKFGISNVNYDISRGQVETFSISINREMHCWQMSLNVTPLGYYKFFNISISPKSGILQDLRINRTRSFFSGY